MITAHNKLGLFGKLGAVSFLAMFFLFTILILTKPITQDEGVFLTIGKYLNLGQLPYQDFFDHKPPSIYFLFAGLFKLFGTNVWVVKLALLLSILAAGLVLKKIGNLHKPGSGWYAAILLLFLLTQFEGYFLIAEPFMLWPLLLSLFLILRYSNKKHWLFLTGALLTVTLLFKQTALFSALPLLVLIKKIRGRDLVIFLAGLAGPFTVLAAYLFINNIASSAWYQVVVLTLSNYPPEPLPLVLKSLQQNFFWTLPIWVLLGIGLKANIPNKKIIRALVLLPLPFIFFRHYPHYWVQILPFVALLAAATLMEIRKPFLSAAVMVFCLAIAGGKVGQDAAPNWQKLRAQLLAAQELRSVKADYLLAENQFTAFYFLMPQRPLNKYLYITEISDADGAQQKTLTDTKSNQDVLILWPTDPNYAYAKNLQRFLLETAIKVKSFPEIGMTVYLNHNFQATNTR